MIKNKIENKNKLKVPIWSMIPIFGDAMKFSLWNFCICHITAIYTFISAYRGNWDVFVKYVDRLVKCCVKGDEFLTVTIWKIVFSNVKSITPVSVFLSSDIRYHPDYPYLPLTAPCCVDADSYHNDILSNWNILSC